PGLGGTADGGGAETGALGQKVDSPRRHRQKSVADVLALEKGRQLHAGCEAGRYILARMHADIDAAGQEGLVDFLGEHSLAADIGQRGVLGLAAIAAGGKDLDPDRLLLDAV